MKKYIYYIFSACVFFPCGAKAQDSFEKFKKQINGDYNAFKQQTNKDFEDFRKQINAEYAAFIKKAWKEFEAIEAIPAPKDDNPIPPVIYSEEDKKQPIKDVPKPFDEVIPIVSPSPQPQPIAPIKESPVPIETHFSFDFFGTPLQVRLSENNQFTLASCNENDISKAWSTLSKDNYNNVINDCLAIRQQYQLCDWAYLLMLRDLSSAFWKNDRNKATLFTAFIYCQSGYKMRLGIADNQLFLLYASKHAIYNLHYWNIDGYKFYPLDCKVKQLRICQVNYPQEKPLSLLINNEQLFAIKASPQRYLQSKRYSNIKVTVYTNENLIKFFDSYPTSMINNDFGTRWAMYADTPLSKHTKETLYPSLKKEIRGMSQLDASNRLLDFIQTAFVYEYDDKVWGTDRAFFAEETLYYPYCDCEDRSILFSRLVRDLLGLKVVLIYYPGHLATAVNFTDYVKGDYIMINNKRYVICDPTYIGAPVGLTMPKMDNTNAKVILL